MTHRNTQKGLHSVKIVIPEIDVTHEMFPNFLCYLEDMHSLTTRQIIDVVDKPHHYQDEWREYHDETQ